MIEADPHARITLTLPRHEHLPEAQRPTFLFHPPRRSHALRLEDLTRRLAAMRGAGEEQPTSAEEVDRWFADAERVLADLLDGWRNVTTPKGEPLAWDGTNLNDAVDEGAFVSLVVLLLSRARLGPAEKKASAPPASSRPESSAGGATHASGNGAAETSGSGRPPTNCPAPSARGGATGAPSATGAGIGF